MVPLHEWSTRSAKSHSQSIVRYTEQVETKIRFIRKVFSKHRTAKISMQISPYYSKLPFIKACMSMAKKTASPELPHCLDRERESSVWKAFSKRYPNFSSLAHWLLKRKKNENLSQSTGPLELFFPIPYELRSKTARHKVFGQVFQKLNKIYKLGVFPKTASQYDHELCWTGAHVWAWCVLWDLISWSLGSQYNFTSPDRLTKSLSRRERIHIGERGGMKLAFFYQNA